MTNVIVNDPCLYLLIGVIKTDVTYNII